MTTTEPTMFPSVVRMDPQILQVQLERSRSGGNLLAVADLAAPLSHPLLGARPAGAGAYRGYQRQGDKLTEPSSLDDDLDGYPFMTARIRIGWPLPSGAIPAVAEIPNKAVERFKLAVTCVESIVSALNRGLQPVIDRIESP